MQKLYGLNTQQVDKSQMIELLTPKQMALADNLAIARGISGIQLMQNAGDVLFHAVRDHFQNTTNVLIVCGIGNNGGDGFILAERLCNSGCKVSVCIIGDISQIKGDARLALHLLPASVAQLQDPNWDQFDLIVDGIFGAGLTRDIVGAYADIVAQINKSPAKVLAIDLPSGINGATGQISGCAIEADLTATFFRKKPGHVLYPGQEYCGQVVVGQIGIADDVLEDIAPDLFHNDPELWSQHFPTPQVMGHKYSRGHTLGISCPIEKSGAIRLAAQAALRIGSGLVTIAAPTDTLHAHAARTDVLMLAPTDSPDQLITLMNDPRLNSICVGPGLDPDETTRELVLTILDHDLSVVLDAGALSAFSDSPQILHDAISKRGNNTVLTPHDGEFNRIFPTLRSTTNKLEKARLAAEMIGATLILKGPDTVIADSGKRAAISDNGSPWLATAGSGDVLSGTISGLLAQGMPEFEAACAAVWFHSEASQIAGPGLIASDLDQGLKSALLSYHAQKFSN